MPKTKYGSKSIQKYLGRQSERQAGENEQQTNDSRVILPNVELRIKKIYLRQFRNINRINVELKPRLIINMNSNKRLPFQITKESKLYDNYFNFSHKGQVKLLMTEMQHLIECLDSADEDFIVIYIGAAPTNKAWLLHEYFPTGKFLMIDPNMFNILIGPTRQSHYIGGETAPHTVNKSDKKFNVSPQQGQIIYYNYSTTNVNDIAGVKPIYSGIRYFDGIQETIIEDKFAQDAPNNFLDNQDAYVDHFYNSDNKIFIIEDYFTDDTAKFVKKIFDKAGTTKTIMWSDMRSDNINTNILIDTARVYIWSQIATARFNMFKFRPPFGVITADHTRPTNISNDNQHISDHHPYVARVGDVDYDGNRELFDQAKKMGLDLYDVSKFMKFYQGEIHTQCWQPGSSAETRYWVNGSDITEKNLVNIDRLKYEAIMHYYNEIERRAMIHQNPYRDQNIYFDRCGDCSIMAAILGRYKTKFDPDMNISEEVIRIFKHTKQHLDKCGHGYL